MPHLSSSFSFSHPQERFDPQLFATVFTSGGSGAPQWLNGLIAEPGSCQAGLPPVLQAAALRPPASSVCSLLHQQCLLLLACVVRTEDSPWPTQQCRSSASTEGRQLVYERSALHVILLFDHFTCPE